MRRLIASEFGIELTIGHFLISGSPSKYICVTRRWANPDPKIDKWMWAGRQLLM